MWKSRRRIVALLGGAAVLLLPFLRIRGRSAARGFRIVRKAAFP